MATKQIRSEALRTAQRNVPFYPTVPGKPVLTDYPTPNLADRIYVVHKDTRQGPYEIPTPGDPFDGPYTDSLGPEEMKGFVFATAVPSGQDAEWADWFYLNERANQDNYNFTIEYPAGDPAYPRITRTYLFLRAAVPANPVHDPIFDELKLVDFGLTRLDNPVFDSLFVGITRVFERLPGAELETKSLGQKSLIPEKYRRLIRTVETNQPVPADYVFPTGLTGDETLKELTQENILRARLKTIEEIIAIDETPLESGKSGEFGNLQILESIVEEGTPPDFGELIQDSQVTALGNGKSIKITVQYPPNLFDLQKVRKTIGQDNLIPEKYRRLIRHVETEKPVPVDYTFPTELVGDQAFIEFAQKTITEARLKVTEEVIATDETPLEGGQTGEFGNLQIFESIVDEGTPPDAGELIQDSRVTALGNGKAIKITTRYPSNLFGLQKIRRTIGQDNLIPEKYRRLIRHVETEQPVPVDYTFPTELTGDQTFIEFAQKTITEARLKITEEVINIDEAPLTGGDVDDYAELIILEEIVDEGTRPLTGFLYKTSRVTPLGNGKSIRITAKYPEDLAARILHDQEHNRKLNVVIPTTRRIAPEGTEIGQPNRSIRALDFQRAEIVEPDTTALEAVLDDYFEVVPGIASLQFPDVLKSIKFVVESTSGDGYGEDNDQSNSFGTSLDVKASATANASASASMIPEIIPEVQEIWAHNIPTKRCTFFIKRPFTEADVLTKLSDGLGLSVVAWPVFTPVEHTIVAYGKTMQLDATAKAQTSYLVSVSPELAQGDGKGYSTSKRTAMSAKTFHIKPTIHGAITVDFASINSQVNRNTTISAKAEVHAKATIPAYTFNILGNPLSSKPLVTMDKVLQDSIGMSIYPLSLGATAGDSAIPNTGLRLHDLHDEMFDFGYTMFEAEVVDFANISGGTGGTPIYPPDVDSPIIRYDGFDLATTSANMKATINPS